MRKQLIILREKCVNDVNINKIMPLVIISYLDDIWKLTEFCNVVMSNDVHYNIQSYPIMWISEF